MSSSSSSSSSSLLITLNFTRFFRLDLLRDAESISSLLKLLVKELLRLRIYINNTIHAMMTTAIDIANTKIFVKFIVTLPVSNLTCKKQYNSPFLYYMC